MKKFILILAIVLGIGVGGIISSHPETARTAILAFQSKPKELTIPALNVQTQIEYVGKDKNGAMEVPKNTNNVAWYMLGPLPGGQGNAVIAGHLDTQTGPAIFAHLSDLAPGDEVTVTDEKGVQKTFVVEKTAVYDEDQFPINDVFGPSEKPRLNLITCTGSFNKAIKEYNKRYVVYTVLKS